MKKDLTYRDAGVDIEKGNEIVQAAKSIAARTRRAGVRSSIGGFGALFDLPLDRYQHPVLVAGTDGVGTKLKLAMMMQKHDTIGIDLVAMCVNDLLCQGAEPLFFLDYFATGQLNVTQGKAILEGIGIGCEQANTALIGGETAELPGLYHGEDYDLAGFCVGVVDQERIIDGTKVKPGDQLIGLAASGPHSNGYSLIRKVLELTEADLDTPLNGKTLGEALLMPTRIYVQPLLKLFSTLPVHAVAHITGGGLIENLPRVLPANTQAVIHQSSWQWPEVFTWLQTRGNIAEKEMYRTFNCGIGMVICIPNTQLQDAMRCLADAGETVFHLGEIESSDVEQPRILIQ